MYALLALAALAGQLYADPESEDASMVVAMEICPRVFDGTVTSAAGLKRRMDEEVRLASLDSRQREVLERDCDMYLVGKAHALLEANSPPLR